MIDMVSRWHIWDSLPKWIMWLLQKENLDTFCINTYIYPERILPKELIFNFIIVNRIRIKSAEALLFQTFLEICHSPGGKSKVNQEYCQDKCFCIGLVQPVPNNVTEENHHSIVLVILWIERVILVDTSAAEYVVEESFGAWKCKKGIKLYHRTNWLVSSSRRNLCETRALWNLHI